VGSAENTAAKAATAGMIDTFRSNTFHSKLSRQRLLALGAAGSRAHRTIARSAAARAAWARPRTRPPRLQQQA